MRSCHGAETDRRSAFFLLFKWESSFLKFHPVRPNSCLGCATDWTWIFSPPKSQVEYKHSTRLFFVEVTVCARTVELTGSGSRTVNNICWIWCYRREGSCCFFGLVLCALGCGGSRRPQHREATLYASMRHWRSRSRIPPLPRSQTGDARVTQWEDRSSSSTTTEGVWSEKKKKATLLLEWNTTRDRNPQLLWICDDFPVRHCVLRIGSSFLFLFFSLRWRTIVLGLLPPTSSSSFFFIFYF